MDLFTDRVGSGLERALDGAAQQQRTTAANIANAATPGYRAQRVSFENNLRNAMADDGTDPATASIDTTDAGTPADANGNTVQLSSEVADQQRESLRYQALAQAMTFKLSMYRTAIDK